MWRTVRFRTTLAATIASAALLVVVSTVTVWLLRAQLTDNLDEGLIARADEIAALLAADPAPELPRNEDVLIQVLAPDGTVRQASASVAGDGADHVGARGRANGRRRARPAGAVPGGGPNGRHGARAAQRCSSA